MNVNVIGASNSVAAVIPEMVARGSGHLVVISSLGGVSWFAKIGCLLRQQGGSLGVL